MKWASIIEQEKIQVGGLVPPVLALLNSIPQLKKEQFKSIKWMSCGTSP
jgi:non-ribosomal peptide synthetase component E (peptide arylation enzyme)